MPTRARTEGNFHALLIGVDSYKHAPLYGCVNDIDLVQQVLLGERMGIAKDQIRRLVAPHPRTWHARTVPHEPATLENIQGALADLGGKKVSAGDRVFIYYSGHGTRKEVGAPDGRAAYCEALVPVDYDAEPDGRFLFDFQINALLRKILARTRSVTVVMDCCYAAGATRAAGELSEALRPRFLDLGQLVLGQLVDGGRAIKGAVRVRAPAEIDREPVRRGVGSVDDCHVVAACMNHEIAKEDARGDRKNGLLTCALVDALESATERNLRTVTWARIWQRMQAYVADRNPMQHPWMAGNLGREVFGGPPVDGDPGFLIARDRDGEGYHVEAGELAGITKGAVLMVYGELPRQFPRAGSKEDVAVRKGRIRVTSATLSSASAVRDGKPFELPAGARGQLMKAGEAARLACAVVPANAALQRQLAASPLLKLVPPSQAEVTLERHGKQWFVTDALHGTPPEPVLVALQPDQLDVVRSVLEHYYAYSRPLRMAEVLNDQQGGVVLRVLSCPAAGVPASKAQAPDLRDASSRGEGTYELRSGATICFQVLNRSPEPLRVSMINAAASGCVRLLGDQEIDPNHAHVFWAQNKPGNPFRMSLPAGKTHCIDRVVAIGRSALDHRLDYLSIETGFDHVLQRSRGGGRTIEDGEIDTGKLDYWAATEAVIETRA
jgi:hypothetical protein